MDHSPVYNMENGRHHPYIRSCWPIVWRKSLPKLNLSYNFPFHWNLSSWKLSSIQVRPSKKMYICFTSQPSSSFGEFSNFFLFGKLSTLNSLLKMFQKLKLILEFWKCIIHHFRRVLWSISRGTYRSKQTNKKGLLLFSHIIQSLNTQNMVPNIQVFRSVFQ